MTEQIDPVSIWRTDYRARWTVPTSELEDANDPWAGWTDVDGDARVGAVELHGVEYTPAEARALAEALRQAADHAAEFGHYVAALLTELTHPGRLPIDHLPSETQVAVRDALRSAAATYRFEQADTPGSTR